MGIGAFVKRKYEDPKVAAKKIYSILAAILGEDEIPGDIIYPLGYTGNQGFYIYNNKYRNLIVDFIIKYVDNDNTFRANILRKLAEILIMAHYPKD